MSAPPPAVQAEALSLWYGGFQALDRVTVELPAGEVIALVGPSGCGKSTLLRCLNRMNDAPGTRVSGALRVLGQDIYDAQLDVIALRRAVGMVFQRPNPLPLSVRDNVLFGLRLHTRGLRRADEDERLEAALRTVELWERCKDGLDRPAGALSLEERQKLCIARLLPLRPQVLLMDEPCSALDAAGTAAVEGLMGRLKGQVTQVIVTHNLAQARRVASVCLFMWLGQLVEAGPTDEVFERPRDPRAAAWLSGRAQ